MRNGFDRRVWLIALAALLSSCGGPRSATIPQALRTPPAVTAASDQEAARYSTLFVDAPSLKDNMLGEPDRRAIGVYLPLASMLPIYVGGCVRARVERARGGAAAAGGDPGILAASGLVAGEGLAGVLVAALVGLGAVPKSKPPLLGGHIGEAAVLLFAAAICFFLHRAGRSRSEARM